MLFTSKIIEEIRHIKIIKIIEEALYFEDNKNNKRNSIFNIIKINVVHLILKKANDTHRLKNY